MKVVIVLWILLVVGVLDTKQPHNMIVVAVVMDHIEET
jgi:hypothetical protein